MPPASILAVFEAAKDAGIRRMIVNHPNFVIEASKQEVQKMADLGALVEHSLCMYDEDSSFYQWEIEVLVDWIQTIGPDRSSLGSDLGQENNPLPGESFRKICGRLLEAGLGEQMVGAAGFDAAHKVRRQHFLVLFNFTDKNSKEPGVGFIDEYDAVALVLIEDFEQRHNVGCLAPACVVSDRGADLA